MDAAEASDGFSPISDQAFIAASRGERELSRFDAENDDAVAFGVVGEGELDLVVRPDARGRGVGSTAIAELLGESDRGRELRAWAHGENPSATAILERSGFRPVRELLRMTLDPSQLPTAAEDPVAPRQFDGGFRTAFYDPASSTQATDWVRVNAAAFADHPEQGKMTVDDFTSLTREEWFAPDDLILCFTANSDETNGDERLAAYAWVKTLRDAPNEHDATGTRTSCELYAIGVHPDHAGHGLGRALLDTVLDRMAQHRPERVSLYVDGDNERAVDLYVRNGFEIEQRSTQWLRG